MSSKIVIENINMPERTSRVDKTKYLAMREALLTVFPVDERGVTQKEMLSLIQPHLPQDFFQKEPVWLVGENRAV